MAWCVLNIYIALINIGVDLRRKWQKMRKSILNRLDELKLIFRYHSYRITE